MDIFGLQVQMIDGYVFALVARPPGDLESGLELLVGIAAANYDSIYGSERAIEALVGRPEDLLSAYGILEGLAIILPTLVLDRYFPRLGRLLFRFRPFKFVAPVGSSHTPLYLTENEDLYHLTVFDGKWRMEDYQ